MNPLVGLLAIIRLVGHVDGDGEPPVRKPGLQGFYQRRHTCLKGFLQVIEGVPGLKVSERGVYVIPAFGGEDYERGTVRCSLTRRDAR